MNHQHDDRDFFTLLCAVCDGTATQDDLAQLEERLIGNTNARRDYLNFVAMHSDLASEGSGGDWATAEAAIADWGVVTRKQSSPNIPPSAAPSRALLASLMVALAFYGTFVLLAWNLRLGNNGNLVVEREAAENSPTSSVATLVAADNCEWQGNLSRLAVGAAIPPGELHLLSGTAQLKFQNGVLVSLQAPTILLPESSVRAALRNGKLLVRVPPRAVGFTVATPTATIFDLGTEFGVETDERGATEVQVLEGKVELRPYVAHKGSPAAKAKIKLSAGDARRIEPDGSMSAVASRDLAKFRDHFARSPATEEVRQIRIEGAHASSTYGEAALSVEHLIRGQGLSGEKHSASWKGTMWHTDLGRVKNEFVLFDLYRPYRLASMKVWNFNCREGGRYAWIGVRRADIYVSISGNGDPVSKPDAWKRVVTDQQFVPGTGKDDYATPTVVLLGNVEARFVGIVITDALGYGPHGDDKTPDVVGLSEVQLFGSRSDSSK